MTEIVKFVSNDEDELLKQINTYAAENYEDIQQVVKIETSIGYVAVFKAIVVFKRRKI